MPANATDLSKSVRSFLATGTLPLSRSVSRIQGLLRRADYNAADLAEQMRTDPTLTTRVMAAANSTFLSKSPCDNITDAVNRLGTTQLTQIFGQVLASTALVTALQRYDMTAEMFWRRAVITAVGAEIAAARQAGDRHSVYLVGLLHEIGMLVVDRRPPHIVDAGPLQYLDFATEYSVDEKRRFNFHQADYGGELLKQLAFPDVIHRLVRQQYRSPQEPLARALYLGRLAKATRCAGVPPNPDLEILEHCGLTSHRKLDDYLTEVNEEAKSRIHGNRVGSRANTVWR